MKSLKVILMSIICASFLTACGRSANQNHENTTSTDSPTEHITERPDNNTTAGSATGNVIDDAGNMVEDAGETVNDAAESIGDSMKN